MTSEENKKDDVGAKAEAPAKLRQIIIETDGNSINLVKAEVSGTLELTAICQSLITYLNKQK